MDKQLIHIDPEEIRAKKKHDEALTAQELAIACQVSYSLARKWWLTPGFPAVDRVVFWSDFVIWRRQYAGLVSPKPASRRPRVGVADRSGEPLPKHD